MESVETRTVIIDANVWVKLARSSGLRQLINRFEKYKLVPVLNSYLLSEVFKAVINNNWASENQALKLIGFIKSFSVFVTEHAIYRLSPDPKDNYLFDLAIQYNCRFIVSDDTKLLAFPLKPVPVKSTNWFFKNFPV